MNTRLEENKRKKGKIKEKREIEMKTDDRLPWFLSARSFCHAITLSCSSCASTTIKQTTH